MESATGVSACFWKKKKTPPCVSLFSPFSLLLLPDSASAGSCRIQSRDTESSVTVAVASAKFITCAVQQHRNNTTYCTSRTYYVPNLQIPQDIEYNEQSMQLLFCTHAFSENHTTLIKMFWSFSANRHIIHDPAYWEWLHMTCMHMYLLLTSLI